MEKYRYGKEHGKECRQGIGWKKTCYKCSWDMLCLFQQNQEKECNDIRGQKKTSEKK